MLNKNNRYPKKFHSCIKRYMTVLESIIALFLLSGLLVILFGFFHELSVFNKLSKKVVQEGFQKRYIESRLSYVFSHIINERDTHKKFYFYSLADENSRFPSLIFTFDNENVLDPYVSGDIVSRLFVNSNHQLCLAIWPILKLKSQNREELISHQKVEILLDNVEDIKFSFLSGPETNSSGKNAKDGPPKGQWLPNWEKSYKQMPVIVKIQITTKKDQIATKKDSKAQPSVEEFSFVLPSSKNPIKFIAN